MTHRLTALDPSGLATFLAPLIADASQYIDTIDETLTLDGLRLVYDRTRHRSAW